MATISLEQLTVLAQRSGNHWETANAELGGVGIVLSGGYTRTQFETDAEAFATAYTSARGAETTLHLRQTAREMECRCDSV